MWNWFSRDDVQIPSSPYFPAYANGAQAQGPPPMVHERFQSVISQLFQHVSEQVKHLPVLAYRLTLNAWLFLYNI